MCSCRYTALILLFFFLAAGTFLFYPSVPEIELVRYEHNHTKIQTIPKPSLNLSFSYTLKVRNRALFSLFFDSVDVSVSYRGRQIRFVSSVYGGRIRARGSLYVDVELTVDGFEVICDNLYFLQDIAKGEIPFVIETSVEGNLRRFFFDFPLKATVSRQVYVKINSVFGNIKRVVAAVALVDTLISEFLSVFPNQGCIWKLLTYLTGKMLVVSRQDYVNINSVGAMAIVGSVICAILSQWVKRWMISVLELIRR